MAIGYNAKMIKRNCLKCEKEVEVESKSATRVLCDDCNPHPKNKFIDSERLIHCRICGFRAKKLTIHINLKHEGVEQYHKQFPDSPLLSEECKRNIVKSDKTKEKMKKSAYDRWGTIEDTRTYKKGYGKRDCSYCGREGVFKLNPNKYKCFHCREKEKQDVYDNKLELKDFVICPLCLEETGDEVLSRVEYITYKHLVAHGYSVEQFKDEFLNHPMKTQTLCDEHSSKLSGENHFNWGKVFDKETCKHCGNDSTTVKNGICSVCRKLDFGFYDEYERVHCRICGLRTNFLPPHIIQFHNIATADYLKLYPNAVLSSDKHCDQISKTKNEYFAKNKDQYHFSLIPLVGRKNNNFRGPNWKRQKNRALERDGNKCTICGNDKKLHVHHKVPFNFFDDDYEQANALENLTTLCRHCHAQEETKFWKELKKQDAIVYFDDRIEIYYDSRVLVQYLNKKKVAEVEKLRNTVWEDTDDFIFCRVCGKRMRVMTQTHLSTHLMTCDDYRELYNDAPFICVNAMQLNKDSNKHIYLSDKEALKKFGKSANGFDQDSDGKVMCRMCGFSGYNLVGHITRKHKVTVQFYLNSFNGSSLFGSDNFQQHRVN